MATKRKRDPGKPYGPATREKKESLFTVKLGLNKFCIDPDLRETIADAARQVSLMTFELGKLLNLHFLLVCEQPGAYMHHLGRNDFYTVVQGVSTKESSCDVRDLSDCASSAVSSVMEAQHIYLSLRPPQLRWGSRSRVGNPLKFSCQAFWDNCSQDQMMNFERRLAQWWQGQVSHEECQPGSVSSSMLHPSFVSRRFFAMPTATTIQLQFGIVFAKRWSKVAKGGSPRLGFHQTHA